LEASAIDYEDISDEKLVALTLGGDADAFGEITRRYSGAVLNAAERVVKDRYTAEDVAQDTFLAAFLGLRSLQLEERVGAWLCGIARRRALRVFSRTRVFDDVDDYADTLKDSSQSPEEILIAAETREALHIALRRLSDKNRSVTELFYLHGVPIEKIASRLQIPEGTVKRRLYDARMKLKGELSFMYEPKKNENADFVKSVMEKVRKLQTYYRDHNNSSDGLLSAIEETEPLLTKLPEGGDRDRAFAIFYGTKLNWADKAHSDGTYEQAVAAAERVKDGDLLSDLFISRWIELYYNEPEAALKFVDDEAIPKVAALGSDKGLGGLKFWRGRVLAEMKDFDGAERDFKEAIRLLPEDGTYRANAVAAVKWLKLLRENVDFDSAPPLDGSYVLGESIKFSDGVLRFIAQPGFSGSSEYITLYYCWIWSMASEFDGAVFYDLSAKVGETRHGHGVTTQTLVSLDETVAVPAGTFERCMHIAVTFEFAGLDSECDVWYAPGAGIVKLHARDVSGVYDELYELDDYEIKPAGDTRSKYVPLAVGNRWSYTLRGAPDYIYQHNERVIEWTDGETAVFSVLQMYALKRGFDELQMGTDVYLKQTQKLCSEWKLSEAIDKLRLVIRRNESREYTDLALRGVRYLEQMRGFQAKEYRTLPSGYRSGYLTVRDGAIYTDENILFSIGLSRWGTRLEENRIFGVHPFRYLQQLLGKTWDDAWTPGFTSETQYQNDGVLRFAVDDADTVTVAAGTFENCVHLRLTLERDTDDGRYYLDKYKYMHCGTKDWWFAPGVGIVKFDCKWGDCLSSSTELTEYELPAMASGYLPAAIGNKWTYEETNLASEGYLCRETYELASGVEGKYLLCVSQTMTYLGTEAQYDAWQETLPKDEK
jgi:RNA polymerase sigma-70 factor (ECF subfamily)